jgi:hypothetical protein
VAAAASEQQPAMPVQQALQGHGSPRMAGFRQSLNEIGPTIVLLTSGLAARRLRTETAVSTRSRRWRTDDESVWVAGRWDAASDDDTTQVAAVR